MLGFPCGSAGKESACNAGNLGSIPGLGRSPGEGKGYPLQYSGLENSVDSIVHGVAESQRQLSNFQFRNDGSWRKLKELLQALKFSCFQREVSLNPPEVLHVTLAGKILSCYGLGEYLSLFKLGLIIGTILNSILD